MTSYRVWHDYAPVPLRLMLGLGFAWHGYPKLFSAEAHAGFVRLLTSIGMPLPEVASGLAGAIEFFGGLMLVAGAFTSIVAALGIVQMTMALFMVHAPRGEAQGIEITLLYVAGFFTLMLSGPGIVSVDWWRSRGSAGRLQF